MPGGSVRGFDLHQNRCQPWLLTFEPMRHSPQKNDILPKHFVVDYLPEGRWHSGRLAVPRSLRYRQTAGAHARGVMWETIPSPGYTITDSEPGHPDPVPRHIKWPAVCHLRFLPATHFLPDEWHFPEWLLPGRVTP